MPVDAGGNPYIVDPNTGQFLPVNAQGQSGQPYQYDPNAWRTSQVQPQQAQQPMGGQNWQSYSGNPNDPQQLAAYVKYLSQQPGADPTLASDPNYWIGKIQETGGLTQGNIGYWGDRSKAGAGNAGGGGPSGQNGFSYTPSDFVNGPFGQYALKAAQTAVNSNLFSRGLGLSTGAGKDLAAATYGALGQLIPQDYAMQQGQFQTNFNNLNTLAGYGLNATNAAAGYNTGAAAAGAAGTVGASNAINQGINNGASAYQNYKLYQAINGQNGGNQPASGYAANAADATQNKVYSYLPDAGASDPTQFSGNYWGLG